MIPALWRKTLLFCITGRSGATCDHMPNICYGTPAALTVVQLAAPPPLCPARHPPQSVAACPNVAARRSSLAWARSRERRSMARPSGPQRRKPPAPGARLTRLLAARGTCACSAFRVRPSHRPRSAMRSMPGTAISKSNALAATRIRPSRWMSCGDRRQRRTMNSNATCGAASVPKSGAIHTSAAIWSRCDQTRFQPTIRRQRGGRASGE